MKTTLTNGMTIGSAKVIVDIVPKGNYEIRPGTIINPDYVTIHNTGNSGRGANAKAHNTYIHNMAKLTPLQTGYASWHLTVDEDNIYQHIPFNEEAWHTGDGDGPKSGNRRSIGIEICMHRDQKSYAKAEANAVALARYLVDMLGISASTRVVPHQKWSGKYCPQVILRRDGSLNKFVKRVVDYKATPAKKPSTPAKKPAVKYFLRSGTYASKVQAQEAIKSVAKLGVASEKYMVLHTTKDKKYYWDTGTYTTKAAAESAKKKIIAAKIAWYIDIKTT